MSLPSVIRSQVDAAAVTKVTRLFNNSLGDVLCELIQNARRAGASAVDLHVSEAEGRTFLTISDDGSGIEDPSVILALGRSGWDETVARREDPAGMGVFSLAGRRVEVKSCARTTGEGWRVEIGADDWEAGAPISVLPCAHPFGTRFSVALDEQWAKALDGAAQSAARYCSIPVRLDGKELPREDWLKGAETIVEQGGVWIGIYRNYLHRHFSPSINFHGVTVASLLPTVSEKDRHCLWRID